MDTCAIRRLVQRAVARRTATACKGGPRNSQVVRGVGLSLATRGSTFLLRARCDPRIELIFPVAHGALADLHGARKGFIEIRALGILPLVEGRAGQARAGDGFLSAKEPRAGPRGSRPFCVQSRLRDNWCRWSAMRYLGIGDRAFFELETGFHAIANGIRAAQICSWRGGERLCPGRSKDLELLPGHPGLQVL